MPPRNCDPGKWVRAQLNIDQVSGAVMVMFNRTPGAAPEVAPLTPELIRSLGDETYSRHVREAQALREARAKEEALRPKFKSLDDLDDILDF